MSSHGDDEVQRRHDEEHGQCEKREGLERTISVPPPCDVPAIVNAEDSTVAAVGGSPDDQLPFSKVKSIFFVGALAGASFLNTLGVQAAVIILPSIGRDLAIPASRQQWVVSAYSLSFGCFLLLFGRIADVFGKRLVFLSGATAFTLLTIVTPFMPNEISFDVLRGLQGLSSAATMSSGMGILGQTFKPGKWKNYAFSAYGAGAPLGSVFGNIVGGLVGQWAGWKWVLWVVAIMAGSVTTAAYFLIPPPPPRPAASRKPTVDWIGGANVTIAMVMLLFSLTEGNIVGWSTPWIPVLIVLSILLLGVFVIWQWYLETRTTRDPLMKVSMFRNSRFAGAQLCMLWFFMSFNNYLIFTTFFFQDYQGYNIIQTMLRYIPTGVAGVLTASATGWFLSRVSGQLILMFGTFCVGLASLLFAVPIPSSTSYFAYGLQAMVLCVFGADTVYPTLTLFTTQSVAPADQALGAALINAVGQTGRAIGLAISTAILTAVEAEHARASVRAVGGESGAPNPRGNPAYLAGLRAANWSSVAYAMTAFIIASFAFRGAGKVGKK